MRTSYALCSNRAFYPSQGSVGGSEHIRHFTIDIIIEVPPSEYVRGGRKGIISQ